MFPQHSDSLVTSGVWYTFANSPHLCNILFVFTVYDPYFLILYIICTSLHHLFIVLISQFISIYLNLFNSISSHSVCLSGREKIERDYVKRIEVFQELWINDAYNFSSRVSGLGSRLGIWVKRTVFFFLFFCLSQECILKRSE